MRAGVDFTVQKSSPHNTAALAVSHGELDAAIVGSGPYHLMPEEIRAQVRILAEVGAMPNAIYLTNKKLPAQRRAALRGALLDFGNNSPEGRRFMEQYAYGGFKPITAAELKPMEAYSQRVKELLATQ
jgi:ABC-type phosphate/phosphonate transport system substrate-binding protein